MPASIEYQHIIPHCQVLSIHRNRGLKRPKSTMLHQFATKNIKKIPGDMPPDPPNLRFPSLNAN